MAWSVCSILCMGGALHTSSYRISHFSHTYKLVLSTVMIVPVLSTMILLGGALISITSSYSLFWSQFHSSTMYLFYVIYVRGLPKPGISWDPLPKFSIYRKSSVGKTTDWTQVSRFPVWCADHYTPSHLLLHDRPLFLPIQASVENRFDCACIEHYNFAGRCLYKYNTFLHPFLCKYHNLNHNVTVNILSEAAGRAFGAIISKFRFMKDTRFQTYSTLYDTRINQS